MSKRSDKSAMPQGSVTIKDVAQKAGFSVATVSHSINGTRKVSEETRERVFAAVHELGYSGHSIARSLRRGRTAILGLVVSDIENPFFTKLASHVQRVAALEGYQVIFANSEERRDREREILDALSAQRVDGIILAPVAQDNAELLSKRQIPMTLVNRHFPKVRAPHVIVDDHLGARLGFDHLWDLGHRTIAIIRGDIDRSTTIERIAGVRDAYRQRGIVFDEGLLIDAGRSEDHGEAGLVELMSRRPRPSAVFALSNWALIAAIRGLQKTLMRCPGDVSLVGYGITSPYWMPAASVTMVEQPVIQMAEASVRLLIAQLDVTAEVKSAVLCPSLTIGQSTAPVETVSETGTSSDQ